MATARDVEFVAKQAMMDRVKRTHQLEFEIVNFSDEVNEIMGGYGWVFAFFLEKTYYSISNSKARGVASESVLLGTLSVVAHLSAHSRVEIANDYHLAPTMLFCISGLIGTNKSGLISLIKDSYIKMEGMYKLIDQSAGTGINNSKYWISCLFKNHFTKN